MDSLYCIVLTCTLLLLEDVCFFLPGLELISSFEQIAKFACLSFTRRIEGYSSPSSYTKVYAGSPDIFDCMILKSCLARTTSTIEM